VAIKRQKINRKANLTLNTGNVIDLPPDWAFPIHCPHHGRIYLDFNPYRENGREDLAQHVRDAFWSQRHQLVGMSLRHQEQGLRIFWRFLDSLQSAGKSITRIDHIDRKLLDAYLAWMELQTTGRGRNMGKPWSISMRKRAFDHLKSVLTNRQKYQPDAVNPALSFPRNPFPNSNQLTPRREAFSVGEQKRILEALNMDLRRIHEKGDPAGESLAPTQVLVVHLLLLAFTTGRNLQSLLDLKRDSLREHPLDDRELLVTTKRRGWTTHATSMRKSVLEDREGLQVIPSSVGDHFRFLRDYTAPLIAEATQGDRAFIFLRRVSKYERKGQVERMDAGGAKDGVKVFVRRHQLLDDRGQPLTLSLSRLRPTFATELYRRTRDIRRVQQALGHANPETTARHYASAPLEAERDHAIVVETMVSHFARQDIDGKVLLAADGKMPLQGLKEILSAGYSTGIARCKNPFRENESVCKKYFACFRCPSMVVFEDDLWRLFSFYFRLMAERAKINPSHWLKTYGPIIRRIDVDIAPLFPPAKVESAKTRAQQTPHPAWRGPLL